MWLWTLIFLPLLLYGAIAGSIFFAQTRLLFPAASVPPAASMPSRWRRLTLETGSRDRLSGVHVPPSAGRTDRPLILVFGGNAWNAEFAAGYVHDLYPFADVVAFHYRGYRPSEGSPGASSLRQDALAIFDFAKETFGDVRIVAIGFSIGSGVASYLAAHRPVDGAILVTPFDSLAQVAADHYPWLPVRMLFRHSMEPAMELRHSAVPIAIIAAAEDRLIRPPRSEKLADRVRNLVFQRTIAKASHNDIYDRAEFRESMHEALEALASLG
jgi:uncharacterized protein